MTNETRISDAFQTFITEAPTYQKAWLDALKHLADASSLDAKTESLVYIGILAATRLDSGLSFHVAEAKNTWCYARGDH